MKLAFKPPRLLTLAAVIAIVAVLYMGVNEVKAQNGQAFSISPPLVDIKAKPGQTVTAKITLTNVSGGELLIKNQLNDFGAKNETGEPSIIFDDNNNTAYSLRQWIVSPEPFRLKSKQSKTIEFAINVPGDAEPGGHYAVIRFTGTTPALEQSGVALNASIGTLVLLQVSGNTQTKANLVDFFSSTRGFAKSNFFETGNFGFVTRIKNEGNVHIKPTGTIQISDMFGKVVQTIRANGDPSDPKDQPRSILPNSIRRFEQNFDKAWMFGRYEAALYMKAEGGESITAKTVFWVIPWKMTLLTLAGLVVTLIILKSAIKKYNRFIIKKARGK